MLDVLYMPKISDRIEYEEILIVCSIWDLASSHGMEARIDGGPCKDYGDSKFGGTEER